jgi:hypothetical protein
MKLLLSGGCKMARIVYSLPVSPGGATWLVETYGLATSNIREVGDASGIIRQIFYGEGFSLNTDDWSSGTITAMDSFNFSGVLGTSVSEISLSYSQYSSLVSIGTVAT